VSTQHATIIAAKRATHDQTFHSAQFSAVHTTKFPALIFAVTSALCSAEFATFQTAEYNTKLAADCSA
jgi:hypothetical protein